MHENVATKINFLFTYLFACHLFKNEDVTFANLLLLKTSAVLNFQNGIKMWISNSFDSDSQEQAIDINNINWNLK